ncbi:MAG: site-specific DNA-methyltransferase [Desulfovibrio sp.]|nr:site-specific DNA-methyltransferase [Desulfovibrio sp.]
MAKESVQKTVGTISHIDDHRTNIPTAELQSIMKDEDMKPVPVSFTKRNPDLDPQLIWRGKYDGDDQLTVKSAPLYIQENIHPSVLIKDLMNESKGKKNDNSLLQFFNDFNGYAKDANKTDFYQHEHNWTNRMILGDSLQVMLSLAEREGLRGKVQCIYMDPPYGIKFNSNFQWSTTSRDVKDGKLDNMTREPEQVKAFRDTWRDGIHSYLNYLRDRFILARDLLDDNGSIFVQIGDENTHKIRILLDEIFGENNFISEIIITKTGSISSNFLGNIADKIHWYGKNKIKTKYNNLFYERGEREETDYSADPILSSGNTKQENLIVLFHGNNYGCGSNNHWKTHLNGMNRLIRANRIVSLKKSLRYKRFYQDFPAKPYSNVWNDTGGASNMIYIVQTNYKIIERCILMSTDPGDLVLDPTCGSGTTAYVAEQWGRRWITIDTSRVALALARMRLMGARYPWYIMTDSKEGQEKEAELNNVPPQKDPTYNNIKLGFVNERVPHITLKSIANNAEIDVIYDKWQEKLEPLRAAFNKEVNENYEEWEIPRSEDDVDPKNKHALWSDKAKDLHKQWWDASAVAFTLNHNI